jgi:hypothetical protein
VHPTRRTANVKTAHRGYPKECLLDLLGYDKKTKLCPKDRRGQSFGLTRTYSLDAGPCTVLAAAHNSKKPVLLVSTASTMLPADDYTKTWTIMNALGELIKYTIRVPTTLVHALYHRFFGIVDFHNHLRQGVTSMADVWLTNNWVERDFAEGIGFWEVNVFKALIFWHPKHKLGLGHEEYRKMLAHAFLTLGKIEYGVDPTAAAAAAAAAGPSDAKPPCKLARFKLEGYHEKTRHKCGYCEKGRAYFYCATCFPDAELAPYAICSVAAATRGECFAKHCKGVKPTHGCHLAAKRDPSPTAANTGTGAAGRRTRARTGGEGGEDGDA